VKEFKGVLLGKVDKSGAAAAAGLKEGDIITKINNVEINSESAFEEELSYRYPGDKINVTYLRNEEANNTTITLLNKNGDTSLVKRRIYSDATVGASLEAVDYGVKVFKINNGIFKKLGMQENYTIVYINRQRVKDPQDVIEFFNKYKGRVYMVGINSLKQEVPYSFTLQ
jgi:C-terminal processing protease CtpA/Prc